MKIRARASDLFTMGSHLLMIEVTGRLDEEMTWQIVTKSDNVKRDMNLGG